MEEQQQQPQQEKKKRGRKPIGEEKVRLVSVYLRDYEKDALVELYGSVTNAIRQEILPKLEKKANL